ncbi:MAG: hypothetical protein WC929_07900 [Bacilli bacterium]|jgi:hypothetical protein
MVRKTIINGGIGPKVICVVTNDELDALPILGTDNGDGTASLTTNSSMAVLPDTVSGDLAAQTVTLEDILAKIIVAPSTEAKQDLIITALGLIATEATTGDIKTATEALAALISAGALAVSLGELPDTTTGDLAAINSTSASIDGKLPTLVGGKIPVDALVSIDSIDIGDVDIKEFPAGNLGQQLKAASLSVAPATDITDATYIGDVKFGEELPAGTQLVGKVGIDQTTPGTTNLVNVNGGASQTTDIKVTLDSESVAVTGPLTDAQLTTQALAKESTLGSIKTAAESLAVATPDTVAGDLASMSADLATIRADLATVKADIILIKADVAKLPQKAQFHENINFSDASARTIIDAPGEGNRIRLTRLSLSSGSNPQVNVEIALKSDATTIETVKGAAMVFDYPEHRNLGTNEAFVVQATTADRIIGGVDYYLEAV